MLAFNHFLKSLFIVVLLDATGAEAINCKGLLGNLTDLRAQVAEDTMEQNLPWREASQQSPIIDQIIANIPAMAHETNLAGIIRIGNSRYIRSRKQRTGIYEPRSAGGGKPTSNYLYPVVKNSDHNRVADGGVFSGAFKIIFNSSLLKRQDYFYTMNSSVRGKFLFHPYFDKQSFTPNEWELSHLDQQIGEINFEQEISLEDYAVAVVVDPLMRVPFQTLSTLNGISWRKLGIEIIYAAHNPSEIDLRELTSKKNDVDILEDKYLTPHLAVQEQVHYNLPSIEHILTYLEDPINQETPLGKETLYALDEHFAMYHYGRDFSVVLRHLNVLFLGKSVNFHWVKFALDLYPTGNERKKILDLLTVKELSLDDVERLSLDQRIPSYIKNLKKNVWDEL